MDTHYTPDSKLAEKYIYTKDTLNMLYRRRENHLNGSSESFTVEESMKKISAHKKIRFEEYKKDGKLVTEAEANKSISKLIRRKRK